MPPRLLRVFFLVALCLPTVLAGCNGLDVEGVKPLAPTIPPLATATETTAVITQTLEGVTIGVQVVYADAHRIVIDLTLDAPAQPYSRSLEFSWSDAQRLNGPTLSVEGKELPWMRDATTGIYAGLVSVAGEPIHKQGTLTFDASGLQWDNADKQNLPLHLSLPLLVNDATVNSTNTLPALHTLPFAFSLDAAFDTRKAVIHVGLTVEENDVEVTLERLDITASEARISLRYSATKPGTFLAQQDIAILANLTIHNREDGTSVTLVGGPDWTCHGGSDADECVFSFSAPSLISSAPIDCTLTVSAGAEHASHVNSYYAPAHDPWVFDFTVPAASTEK